MAEKKDKLSTIILLGFIVFFILAIRKSWTQQSNEETLMSSYKITQGRFADCGVGKPSDFGHYTFILNDQTYTSYFDVDKYCFQITAPLCQELKDYTFPVAYNPENPDLNTMLLSKLDYGKYKIARGDSLSHVFERYFDCR